MERGSKWTLSKLLMSELNMEADIRVNVADRVSRADSKGSCTQERRSRQGDEEAVSLDHMKIQHQSLWQKWEIIRIALEVFG